MSELLDHLSVWHWFALGLVLIILELIVNSGFLLWIAIASGVVGIVVALVADLTGIMQLLIFGGIASVSCIIGQVYVSKRPQRKDSYILNRRNEQYIGRSFILTEPILNGLGHIQVDDSLWRIKGPDLAVGSKIKVIGSEGMFLLITPEE